MTAQVAANVIASVLAVLIVAALGGVGHWARTVNKRLARIERKLRISTDDD